MTVMKVVLIGFSVFWIIINMVVLPKEWRNTKM